MKIRTYMGIVCLMVAAVAVASRPFPQKVSVQSDGGVGSTATAGTGWIYGTGFEPAEGFALGHIGQCVQPAGCASPANPCWGKTSAANASSVEGHIDTIHPASGAQHLRLSHDPATRTNQPNFNLGVDARIPCPAHTVPRPIAANTVSVDVAIDALFGQDFRIQPQSNSQGFLATSLLMHYAGGLYVLDDQCGTVALSFMPVGQGVWDSTGAYQNYTVAMNPCANSIDYYYAGTHIYSSCVIAGQTLEQFLVFGDNFSGSSLDVDNVILLSLDSCICDCGEGIIEDIGCGDARCEPGNDPTGCNPGHICGAVGSADECFCSRTCTLAEPCVLENGMNGPFYGPFDATYGGIFIYEPAPGVNAASVELCGSTGTDQRIFFWGSAGGGVCVAGGTPCNVDADCVAPDTCGFDPGADNDDCCDPNSAACGANLGAGSDPSASCYNNVGAPNYESCTCYDIPSQYDQTYLLQIRPPQDDGQVFIEVNKKAVCAGAHLGACCDTNGADAGCNDNTLSAACVGADKVWTENGKCADISCACIPDCTGRTCGDDGCGGSCGTCDDTNACNGVESCNATGNCDAGQPLTCNDNNACNGVETCNTATGCRPGNPLNCNDGVACNGIESCNPSSGCVAGTAVSCDDGIECTVDACNEPDGSCTNDDSDCAIPAVSAWGLVILALILLVAAKTMFRRPSVT